VIYGDGEQSRDFIFVEDVVQANLMAAESAAAGGECINIASGEGMTVNGLLAAVNEVLGTKAEPVCAPARPGDIKHSIADMRKARRLMNYQPAVSFMAGLKKTIAWYKGRS
jgi:UDP-glucose 4-epimerase